jgi:signal transduction histidine kinase
VPSALRVPFLLLRTVLVAVCVLLAVVEPRHPAALPFIAGLAVAAAVVFAFPRLDPYFPILGILVVGVGVPYTGSAHSPLLPYLLAPGLTVGLTRGLRDLLYAVGLASAMLLLVPELPGASQGGDYAPVVAEWVVLMLSLGLVADRSRRLTPGQVASPDLYLQVRQLLEQLHNLTRRLPGGLDAPGTARAMLERCCAGLPQAKGAVLSHTVGGAFVPLAVVGARRVPWRTPLTHEGPLRTAWQERRLVLQVRNADTHGRRSGSALVALPLSSSGEPYGLLVLESADPAAFTPVQLDRVGDEVEAATSQLEAALLFEEVRLLASLEERDRLAKEMHDGIAQDLAFLGYRLDDLRGRAVKVSPELSELALEIRTDLTSLISDLRMSITELRNSVRADQGLGNVLTTYLQSVCSGKDVLLTLSLQETGFRLPADLEVALLQSAQAFAQEVRRSRDVTQLTVWLAVDPPSAELHMSCDGTAFNLKLDGIATTLVEAGGTVTTSLGQSGGPTLDIVLRGEPVDDQRAPGRRPRPDPPRAASGVRADD